MGQEVIQRSSKREDIQYINEQFKLGDTVNQLHHLMKEVTKEEITPNTVHAACNCVKQLNSTIDMAIKAAGFLSDNR
jgi:hypothetical protein